MVLQGIPLPMSEGLLAVLELPGSPSKVAALGKCTKREAIPLFPVDFPSICFCRICRAVAVVQASAARCSVSSLLPVSPFTAPSLGLWTSWCLAASRCISLPLCLQLKVMQLILTPDHSRFCRRVIENARIPR